MKALRLHNRESVVFSATAASTGGHRSLAYVPGATLWGRAAARLYADRSPDTVGQRFGEVHSGALRFGPGFPLSPSGRPAFPMPQSLQQPKHDASLHVGEQLNIAVWNTAHPSAQERRTELGQGEAIKGAFLSAAGEVVRPRRAESGKTAVIEDARRAAEAQFFQYEHLAPGQDWLAWIDGEAGAAGRAGFPIDPRKPVLAGRQMLVLKELSLGGPSGVLDDGRFSALGSSRAHDLAGRGEERALDRLALAEFRTALLSRGMRRVPDRNIQLFPDVERRIMLWLLKRLRHWKGRAAGRAEWKTGTEPQGAGVDLSEPLADGIWGSVGVEACRGPSPQGGARHVGEAPVPAGAGGGGGEDHRFSVVKAQRFHAARPAGPCLPSSRAVYASRPKPRVRLAPASSKAGHAVATHPRHSFFASSSRASSMVSRPHHRRRAASSKSRYEYRRRGIAASIARNCLGLATPRRASMAVDATREKNSLRSDGSFSTAALSPSDTVALPTARQPGAVSVPSCDPAPDR